MSCITLNELQEKDVINVVDGTNLGNVIDAKIEILSGNIKCISVKCTKGVLSLFSKKHIYVVSWDQIIKIGDDVIIVNLPEEAYNKDEKD